MASTSRRTPLLLVAVVLLVGGAAIVAEAQTPTTQTCVQKLVPCGAYLNSTSPPDACCNPIKEVVRTDLACLCTLYNTPGLLAQLGINITQALQLTKECGVSTDTSTCNASASPPSSTSPPATPGGDSDAGRLAWSGVLGLFLMLASMMLH